MWAKIKGSEILGLDGGIEGFRGFLAVPFLQGSWGNGESNWKAEKIKWKLGFRNRRFYVSGM